MTETDWKLERTRSEVPSECIDKETGLYKGWICPTCFSIYPNKEQAIYCRNSHEELEEDYYFEIGSPFPAVITITRKIGNQVVEIASYKRTSVEKVN